MNTVIAIDKLKVLASWVPNDGNPNSAGLINDIIEALNTPEVVCRGLTSINAPGDEDLYAAMAKIMGCVLILSKGLAYVVKGFPPIAGKIIYIDVDSPYEISDEEIFAACKTAMEA